MLEIDWSRAEEIVLAKADAPKPKTYGELVDFIQTMTTREHEYGTAVYALSLCSVATFNFLAHKLGVTGFQASCADLDILSRIRQIKGPMAILEGSRLLYPQYSNEIPEKYAKNWAKWAKTEALRLISESGDDPVNKDVLAHWVKLARAKLPGERKTDEAEPRIANVETSEEEKNGSEQD
jgi:hypothetical protein